MAAISCTAEAGQTYYFQTKTPRSAETSTVDRLVPVHPVETQILLAATSFSTCHLKN